MAGECLGGLEFASIAVGLEAIDAMLKADPVTVLLAGPVSPGKFIVLVRGDVDAVKHALQEGRAGREEWWVDDFVLPNPHEGLVPTIEGRPGAAGRVDAAGIIETMTVASCIAAADVALKTARVELLEMRLAIGIGGKSFVTMAGEVSDVRASILAAAEEPRRRGLLVREIVIPAVHDGMGKWLRGN